MEATHVTVFAGALEKLLEPQRDHLARIGDHRQWAPASRIGNAVVETRMRERLGDRGE